MPNNIIITPKTFAVIVLASLGREVGCFVVQLPEQLLLQAQEKAMSATVRMKLIWEFSMEQLRSGMPLLGPT